MSKENKLVSVQVIDGKNYEVESGMSLYEFIACHMPDEINTFVAACVEDKVKDLHYKFKRDCRIKFLPLDSAIGHNIYQRSIFFLLITAVKELFAQDDGDYDVNISHSLGKGIYCDLLLGRSTTTADVRSIERKMHEIIAENRPILPSIVKVEEAIELFKEHGQTGKVKLLGQIMRDDVRIYHCGDVCDYFYGAMVPYTGYLKSFSLEFYPPGLILLVPERGKGGKVPSFVDQPKLAQILSEAEEWGRILHCRSVGSLNECTLSDEIKDVVRVAEALHEKKLAYISDFIAKKRDRVRLILIAGPSSSGKTTFAKRLCVQLRVNDIRPVVLSLDDYFVNRDQTPLDENGDYDFESIESIDLKLFNEHLEKILQGEKVEIPTFNFKEGKREYKGHTIQLKAENEMLVVEGIHGLNERLTSSIARTQKVKLYVSALTQLAIDRHNRIPTTDGRLLRRIVRDNQYRGNDALKTLKMWPSVRAGEEKNIFPFQEEADIMFNSALIYEFAVLKAYAEPLLREIKLEEGDYYLEAQRLLKFLSFFLHADSKIVPSNSILREFIGGSCFE